MKGVGAFVTFGGIYSYLPYLVAYFGSTIPIASMCFAGLYGMLSFSESQIVNSISVIESGDHVGKLLINIGVSAFASKNIIASVRDVQSVMQLENDNIGEEDGDGNIIKVDKYYDESTGKLVE